MKVKLQSDTRSDEEHRLAMRQYKERRARLEGHSAIIIFSPKEDAIAAVPVSKELAEVHGDWSPLMYIFQLVSLNESVSVEQLRSSSKEFRITRVRKMFYYLARVVARQSPQDIAAVSFKDRSTVISGINSISARRLEDAALDNRLRQYEHQYYISYRRDGSRLKMKEERAATMRHILSIVANGEELDASDILASSSWAVTSARNIFYHLANTVAGITTPEVGKFCNSRTHSGVVRGKNALEIKRKRHYQLDKRIKVYEKQIEDYIRKGTLNGRLEDVAPRQSEMSELRARDTANGVIVAPDRGADANGDDGGSPDRSGRYPDGEGEY